MLARQTLFLFMATMMYWPHLTAATELKALPQAVAPPALSLPDLSGTKRTLEELRGKVVLVNFWASWCRPCVAEMPSMQQLATRLQDRPFALLAVNVEESKATVWRFRKLLKLRFTTLLDRDGTAARDWRVRIYPTSYLLDAQGNIRYLARGALEWDQPEVLRIVESLLPAP